MKHPIATYRQEKGLSQAELARSLNVSRWTVAMIECGRRQPSAELLSRLARLGVDVVDLLKRRAA
jgi:transcriptional regulator with XRE-family HTH domain